MRTSVKIAAMVLSAAFVASALTSSAFADCQSDATAARSDLEAKGKALQAASKRKAPPQELCGLFRAYTAAEAKWVKFLTENKDWCQIPPQFAEQARAGSRKTADMRDKVCQAAASGAGASGPAKPPAQSSISSALGITTGYTVGNSDNKGVFGTLNGSALK